MFFSGFFLVFSSGVQTTIKSLKKIFKSLKRIFKSLIVGGFYEHQKKTHKKSLKSLKSLKKLIFKSFKRLVSFKFLSYFLKEDF